MALPPRKTAADFPPSADRIWAEQLAIGMALLLGLLAFMSFFHPENLSIGADVLGPNYIVAYGWASVLGIVSQVVIHEAGTLLVAWRLGLPVKFRFFGFGAHATAILDQQPRRPWTDALIGFSGPITGTLFSGLLTAIYLFTRMQDESMQVGNPFFLGMACIGFFYNLFTLIPILDLEGGWIAPAIAPQAWLFGLVASVLELSRGFNLVLLCVVCFGLPRLILLISARTPQVDKVCTGKQRLLVSVGYFALVIFLAWLATSTYAKLAYLVPEAKGD